MQAIVTIAFDSVVQAIVTIAVDTVVQAAVESYVAGCLRILLRSAPVSH